DDEVEVLAEIPDVDRTGEDELDLCTLQIEQGIDLAHTAGADELGVGEIETQRPREPERQAILAAVGGNAGQFRQFEDVAREGRLPGDPYVDGTDLAQLRQLGALARALLRLAGP